MYKPKLTSAESLQADARPNGMLPRAGPQALTAPLPVNSRSLHLSAFTPGLKPQAHNTLFYKYLCIRKSVKDKGFWACSKSLKTCKQHNQQNFRFLGMSQKPNTQAIFNSMAPAQS